MIFLNEMKLIVTHFNTPICMFCLSVQFSSVIRSCLTLCNPLDCSMPGFRWYHSTISSSVIPFSSCLQSFTVSQSFPMSQFFASDSQSIEVSASASVLPMNIQDWFPLGLNGLSSLQSKGLSRVFSNATVQRQQFFSTQLYGPTFISIPDYWENHSFD